MPFGDPEGYSPYDTSPAAQADRQARAQQTQFAAQERALAQQQQAEAARREEAYGSSLLTAPPRDPDTPPPIYPWEQPQEPDPDIAMASQADERLAEIGLPDAPPDYPEVDDLFAHERAMRAEADRLRAMAGARTTASVPVAEYPAVQGFTGEMLGTEGQPGLLEQQEQAMHQQQEAQRLEAEAAAQSFDERAQQYRDMAIDQKAFEFVRQEQLAEQQQRQQAALTTYEDAAKKVRQAQVSDPDAWWKNKSTGGKIAAVVGLALGAIGGGLAGRPDMGAQIRQQLMQPELDKQKEEYQRLVSGMGAAGDVVDAQTNLYAQMMGSFQNEAMADMAVRASVLEAIDAEMDATMAGAGVDVLSAEQQVERNAIKQELANLKMQIEIMAATTPARRTVSAYALPRDVRGQALREAERLEEEAKEEKKLGYEVRKSQLVDMPKQRQLQGFQAEQAKEKLHHKAVLSHADKVSEFEADITTAKGILNLPNLKGQGVGGSIGQFADPQEAARVRDQIESLGIDPDDYTTESGLRGAIRSKIQLRQGQTRANARRLSPQEFKLYYGREKPGDPAGLDEAIGIEAVEPEIGED